MIEEIPVLKIGPVLMVTIQTDLHDRMAEELQDTILERVGGTGASAVLIDITALQTVDSFIGRILSETARMARVMNAKVVLVGMRPPVTMTLLEMGLEISDVETAIDIETGLSKLGYALREIEKKEGDGEARKNKERDYGSL